MSVNQHPHFLCCNKGILCLGTFINTVFSSLFFHTLFSFPLFDFGLGYSSLVFICWDHTLLRVDSRSVLRDHSLRAGGNLDSAGGLGGGGCVWIKSGVATCKLNALPDAQLSPFPYCL